MNTTIENVSNPTATIEGDQERRVALSPMQAALEVAGVEDKSFWSSFVPETEAQAAILHQAITMAGAAVADHIGQLFDVAQVVLHRVEVEDEVSKEIKTLTRMVLISPDGKTLATCSTGALNSFMALCRICGVPPWNPAKTLKVHQLSTRRKRRTFSFEYLAPPEAQAADGKKKK